MKKQRNAPNWRRGDFLRLEKAVSDFNKKINELEKTESASYLPEKIDAREMRQKIITKNELTRYLRDLRRFSEKGQEELFVAESGEQFTKWEAQSLQKQANIRIKKLTQDLKPYQVKDEHGHTKVQMGNTEARAIQFNIDRLKNLFKTKNENEKLDRLKNYIRSTGTLDFTLKKSRVYKENYLKVIRKNYQGFDGYKELIAKLRTTPPVEFYQMLKDLDDINIEDVQYQSDSVMTQAKFYKFISDLGIELESKTKEIIETDK